MRDAPGLSFTLSRRNSESSHRAPKSPPAQMYESPRTPPPMPPRYPSFSKRHASFHSPREVPLPSPNLLQAESAAPFFSQPLQQSQSQQPFENAKGKERETPASGADSDWRESRSAEAVEDGERPPVTQGDSTSPHEQSVNKTAECQADNPMAPSAPGSGLMDSSPIQFSRTSHNQHADLSTPSRLPPHQQQPGSTLPPALSTTWSDRFSSSSSLPLPSQIPFYTLTQAGQRRQVTGNDPLPAPATQFSQNSKTFSHCPPLDESSSESSVGSSSSSSSSRTSSSSAPSIEPLNHKSSPTPSSPLRTSAAEPPSRYASPSPNLPPRPISPFRAPQPPPSSQRPYVPPSLPTAMRRSLPASSQSSYAAPDAPTILENDPEPSDNSGRVPAPYEVFLNRAPQPADSWLQIETLEMEYRLFARLPGFTREGITLATKRRRILHLVADKWDRDGGHFERRIAFGHDADLMQVRAEFDGEMLRVCIPRRQPAWSSSRIAYSGRA